MLTKRITYKTYDDLEVTEDFMFNLNKAELTELELVTPGGFTTYIQRIIDAKDNPALVKAFKDIIFMAYGEKSQDGRHFNKSKELSMAFSQTEAYSELFCELTTDADAAAAFMNGIVPKVPEKGSAPKLVK